MYSRIEIPERERGKVILYLLPLVIFFLLIFTAGIVFAVLQSAGFLMPVESPYHGIDSYKELFSDTLFIESFFFSMKIAFITASISIIIAVPFSVIIWRIPYKLRKFSTVYKIPVIMPHIAVAFIILLLLSPSGFFSSILYRLSFIADQNDFPGLLYSSSAGIITAYLYKETPFAMLMCLSVLSKIPDQMIQSAEMLGASAARILFQVILPQLRSILYITFTILFLYSFGAFDIPYLLGGSRPMMLSVYIFNLYFKNDLSKRPLAMAALTVTALFAVLFIIISRNIRIKKGGTDI